MNFVQRAWVSEAPSSQFERLVLVFVASHCGRDGRVRVAPREVAPVLRCSVRKLDAALASLASAGVIDAVRWNDTGAWSVTVKL